MFHRCRYLTLEFLFDFIHILVYFFDLLMSSVLKIVPSSDFIVTGNPVSFVTSFHFPLISMFVFELLFFSSIFPILSMYWMVLFDHGSVSVVCSLLSLTVLTGFCTFASCFLVVYKLSSNARVSTVSVVLF